MATRSDLLTRLRCAEARWGPTLEGAIIDHFHGPSLLMGRQALRPYRYRRIPVGGHEAVAKACYMGRQQRILLEGRASGGTCF